jgi:hypothetical protein
MVFDAFNLLEIFWLHGWVLLNFRQWKQIIGLKGALYIDSPTNHSVSLDGCWLAEQGSWRKAGNEFKGVGCASDMGRRRGSRRRVIARHLILY